MAVGKGNGMSHYTEAYVEKQLAAIARVRELHKPVDNYCDECSMYLVEDKYSVYIGYPCPTIKALDGEQ